MKKLLIPILLVLVLGLCLLSACGRHPGTTKEVTEPSSILSISVTMPSATSAPTETPTPTPTSTPEPTPTPEPVYIYMDFEGNVIDKSVLDPYSEVDGVKYFVYEADGQYGVKTGDGKILTEAIYDQIYDYSQITKSAYVLVDGLAGMIDLNGNVVIEPKYDPGNLTLEHYEGSLFFFLQDGLYGALDLNGNVVFDPTYADIYLAYGNPQYYAVDNEDGKSGIIDNKGNLVVERQHGDRQILGISPNGYYFTWEGLYSVDGDHYVTYNNQAEIIVDPDTSAFWSCSDDGENFGIFNILTGEYQYPPTGGPSEDNYVFWGSAYYGVLPTAPYATFEYAGKQGIADIEKGTIMFEPIYEEIEYSQNGYFKYSENGKYGLMNASGKILLSCQYNDIYYTSPFGEVVVSTNDGQGIVNTSGKTLLAPQDSYQIGPYLSEMNGFEISLSGNRDSIGIANRDGAIRVEPKSGIVAQKDWLLYDDEYDYTNTDFFILDGEDGDKILRKDGFVDILDYVDYSGELIIVQDKNGLMGLINASGETLIEPFAKSVYFAYNNHGLVCLQVVE